MDTHRADRDPQDLGGLLQCEAMVEDQVQDLPLPLRQRRERALEHPLDVRSPVRFFVALPSRVPDVLLIPDETEPVEHSSPARFGRRVPDHRKEPGLERRPAIESRFPLQHLQVYGLQDVFGFDRIPRATVQGPPVALTVVLFQLIPQS